jgi:Fe2+ transport system protein B
VELLTVTLLVKKVLLVWNHIHRSLPLGMPSLTSIVQLIHFVIFLYAYIECYSTYAMLFQIFSTSTFSVQVLFPLCMLHVLCKFVASCFTHINKLRDMPCHGDKGPT